MAVTLRFIGTLLAVLAHFIAVSGQFPVSCFSYINNFNCIYQAQIGGTGGFPAPQKQACLPLPHSFTWASNIDTVGMLAYAMGGQSTSYRTLYTVNLTNGAIINSPNVGEIYDTAYNLAADMRGNGRLYGAWNTPQGYILAEINAQKGAPTQQWTEATWTPNNDTNCLPFYSFDTGAGYFDLSTTSYVTVWTCKQTKYIVRINVDTGAVSYIPVASPSMTGFGVHPNGRMFQLTDSSSGPQAYVYEITTDGEVNLVTEITRYGVFQNLWNQLVLIENGVCIFEPMDLNRAHPEPEDLVCAMFGPGGVGFGGTAMFSTPNLSGTQGMSGYIPYVQHSLPSACNSV